MKTLHIVATCISLLCLDQATAASANDQYLEAMQKCIAEIYNGSDIVHLQRTVNALERIAAAEPEKWEPQYYAAFGYLMMVTRETDGAKKDGYLDRAHGAIEQANALMPDDSEIIALQGFVYMLRIAVDPASRGQELAPVATQILERAIRLNPENPRALILTAQMKFGSAKFLGGSTHEACSLASKSLSKFTAQKTDNPLAPKWGRRMGESMLQQCM